MLKNTRFIDKDTLKQMQVKIKIKKYAYDKSHSARGSIFGES